MLSEGRHTTVTLASGDIGVIRWHNGRHVLIAMFKRTRRNDTLARELAHELNRVAGIYGPLEAVHRAAR